MKELLLLATFTMLGILAKAQSVIQPKVPLIIKNVLKAQRAIKTVSNKVSLYEKIPSSKDTLKYQGNCTLKKLKSDYFGYKLKIKQSGKANKINDGSEIDYMYDGNILTLINNKYKYIRLADTRINKSYYGLLKGWPGERLIFNLLFDADKFNNLISDTAVKAISYEGEEFLNKTLCYKIKLSYLNDTSGNKFNDFVSTLYIAKASFLPVRQINTGEYEGESIYFEITLTNLLVNKDFSDAAYSLKSELKTGYSISQYQPPSGQGTPLLKEAAVAPDWELVGLDGKKSKLSDYSGKVVILDFWYVACAPCWRTYPVIEKLFETYHTNGLEVFGMNNYDKDTTLVKRVLANKKIPYQNFIIDNSLAIKYQVTGYPTVYVIGRNGKILASFQGFSEIFEEKITEVVKKEIETGN